MRVNELYSSDNQKFDTLTSGAWERCGCSKHCCSFWGCGLAGHYGWMVFGVTFESTGVPQQN